MGERGSKDAGEGKCGEVRKNSGGDQDPQKEFLMDPEIEAGDMKEEQEPQQSIEVASLQRNVRGLMPTLQPKSTFIAIVTKANQEPNAVVDD
ncbi:hypothetical protein NQZ68_012669 [Dissostichus eleginoides]|nr:hypothetical protein NQZ68_012669 [Dissostichus eleginoides]